jgi:abequosyltransferase
MANMGTGSFTSNIPKPPRLSFCIPTLNRAQFLDATLASIVGQATVECELVVLDGGSADNTDEIVSKWEQRFAGLRYIKQQEPKGVDCAIDEVIKLARGEYCWLCSSKDLLKPGAVAAVLKVLRDDVSLVAVNMEIRNTDLTVLLVPRSVPLESDAVYGPEDTDRLFREAFNVVSHMSCLIIKRTLWLARERVRHYGSLYVHLAVVFQEPLPGKAIVVAKTSICHRFGGQSWLSGAVKMELMWSPLIESLAISESTKRIFARSSAMKRFRSLLLYRACGLYSWSEYHRAKDSNARFAQSLLPALAALVPGSLLNAFFVLQGRISADNNKNITLQMLRASRFHVKNWRLVAR